MAKEPKKLEPIKNEKARLATFKKRKNSLLKKAWEFKTLCDVDACMIIYGPKQRHQPGKAETWASEEGKLTSIINRYKGKHQDDRRQRTAGPWPDSNENTVKQVPKKSRILEYATWDQRFDSFSEDQMKKALCRLNTKLAATVKKIETMKGSPKAMRKSASETSEDSQISHNHIHNVDSHRQCKGKSTDIQQPINFQPNNRVYQIPSQSLTGTPIWMRRNANNPYQNGGASSSTSSPQQSIGASISTIPFTPLRPPVQWNVPISQHPLQEPVQWWCLPLSQTPLPGQVQWNLRPSQPNRFLAISSSAPSNENTAQLKRPSVNSELQPPGQQLE
ncbi:agamous-like MADS-box protein AGL82 [Mangifera indica]|uniref:agamous-like MADS-box protein AGL82 n=1 Tax=Mangifera indica TaxID=29780 RepID=UPI001CFBCE85|nr:agamous-like MADS-box protein AGL82 [Mangifera indica]